MPDLAAIGELCRRHGLVYVVDNTITSPALFQPRSVGASLVVNSLSKTIGGHGAALGGAVTDTGLFDWSGYPNLFEGYRKGDAAAWGLQQIRKKGLRDLGASLAPEAAHRISLGAETLELRVQRCSDSALALAQWLLRHPAVQKVHYPGLPEHPQHAIAQQHFKAASWLMSFELRRPERLVEVLDRLQLVVKATGRDGHRRRADPGVAGPGGHRRPDRRLRAGLAGRLRPAAARLEGFRVSGRCPESGWSGPHRSGACGR